MNITLTQGLSFILMLVTFKTCTQVIGKCVLNFRKKYLPNQIPNKRKKTVILPGSQLKATLRYLIL